MDINAPAPVDQYDLVMVTVEPAGGSLMPSAEVVLQADPSALGTSLKSGTIETKTNDSDERRTRTSSSVRRSSFGRSSTAISPQPCA